MGIIRNLSDIVHGGHPTLIVSDTLKQDIRTSEHKLDKLGDEIGYKVVQCNHRLESSL